MGIHPSSSSHEMGYLANGIDQGLRSAVPSPIGFQPWLRNYGVRHWGLGSYVYAILQRFFFVLGSWLDAPDGPHPNRLVSMGGVT